MDTTTSTVLKAFLDAITDIQKRYDLSSENVNLCDKATQDYLHQLELGNENSRRKTATQLARTRQARRIYKDYVESAQPLMDFLAQPDTVKVMRKLQETLGAVRKAERSHEHREYKPRVIQQLDFLKKEDKNEQK